MKTIRNLLLGSMLSLAILAPLAGSVHASETMKHSVAATLTDGEVRKLDAANAKITIKHGPIQHMDMPGMTMVFTVSDKALLNKVKIGDSIRFMVRHENGKMMVTEIQPAKSIN